MSIGYAWLRPNEKDEMHADAASTDKAEKKVERWLRILMLVEHVVHLVVKILRGFQTLWIGLRKLSWQFF